jgi:hypothetical protein
VTRARPGIVAATLVLSACGSGSHGPVSVGSDVHLPSVTVAASVSSTASPATPTTAPTTTWPASPGASSPVRSTVPRDVCLGPDRPGPSNVETRTDPSGWRLTLTVADRLCFTRRDSIVLQIDIANAGRQPLQYDSGQIHYFSIVPVGGTPGAGWQDTDCTSRRPEIGAPPSPPLTIAPGDSTTLTQGKYPSSDPGSAGERCRHLAGTYDVYGIVRWCPPGSTAKGSCDNKLSRDVLSAPIRIRIT